MKRREAEDRIAAALTDLAVSRLAWSAEIMGGMPAVGSKPTARAFARIARLVGRIAEHRQGDVDRAAAAVAEVLVARGAAGRRAHTEASSLTRLVETLVYDFPTEQELTRAARMLAADAAGREPERPKRLRAAKAAWQALHQAQSDAMPSGKALDRLMTAGPTALQQHMARRRRELRIDDLRATFTRAWGRCLEP